MLRWVPGQQLHRAVLTASTLAAPGRKNFTRCGVKPDAVVTKNLQLLQARSVDGIAREGLCLRPANFLAKIILAPIVSNYHVRYLLSHRIILMKTLRTNSTERNSSQLITRLLLAATAILMVLAINAGAAGTLGVPSGGLGPLTFDLVADPAPTNGF